MKKMDVVKQLIEELNTKKAQTVKLNPVIAPKEVKAFEKKYKVTLLGSYVDFITRIGDGAVIQSEVYGTQELLKWCEKSPWYLSEIYSLSDNDSLDDLDQPFFIQTKSDYVRILEKGRKRCNEPGGKNIWEYLFKREDYEGGNIKTPWALPQFQLMHGCIPIMGKGTPSDKHDIVRQYILILNGDYKGEIWSVADDWIEPVYNTEMPINALTVMKDIVYGGV